jgi:hypothetical protein
MKGGAYERVVSQVLKASRGAPVPLWRVRHGPPAGSSESFLPSTAFIRSNPVDFTGQSKHRYAPWLNRNENLCIVILVCLSLALR